MKEKEKQIERLNIYSRKQKSLKQSVSTGNLSAVGSDHFAYKLGSKLNLLRKRKESFHIIEENIRDLCDKCKEQLDDRRPNEDKIENVKKNNSIEEDSNASKKIETVEISVVKKEDKIVKTTNDEEANEERDEETSSIEEILEGKLSSPGGSLRSNKTMTPQEKVRLWLPMNSETKWDNEKKEMKVNFVLDRDSQDKEDEFKIEEKNSKETDIENDSLNDEPANFKENEYFKESFETVVNAPIP